MTFYYDDNLGRYHVKWAEGVTPDSHCNECLRPANKLCDYPVGDEKTCDRLLCKTHTKHIAHNIDYCESHYKMYMNFIKSGVAEWKLSEIVPLHIQKQLKDSI